MKKSIIFLILLLFCIPKLHAQDEYEQLVQFILSLWTPDTNPSDGGIYRLGNTGVGLAHPSQLFQVKNGNLLVQSPPSDWSLTQLPSPVLFVGGKKPSPLFDCVGCPPSPGRYSNMVGICTDQPAANLHVNGNFLISNGAEPLLKTNGTNVELIGKGNWSTIKKSKNILLKLTNAWDSRSGALNEPTIQFSNGELPTSSNLKYWNIGGSIASANNFFRISYYDNFAEKEVFRVNKNGCVGINTTIPDDNYKLTVNGSIRAKEVRVNTGWNDYVFNNDYKLRSLDELQKFIKDNGHLPEIPTTSEVEAYGIDVGNMNALLLKKIEELTLYILQQQKEIDELK